MDKNKVSDINFTVIDGDRVYIGAERRSERRRQHLNERVETLLRNFGLDRRINTDRRRENTSWFLTSKKVVNE